VSADVVTRPASYGLDLVDALTGGPLLGSSLVVETTSGVKPYLVNASRWVFEGLPPGVPARFVITARHYVAQTVTTGGALPNPGSGGAGHLAVITMMPRTGYPFSPTLTRVIGQVRLAPALDATSPPVPLALVTLTSAHDDQPPPPLPSTSVEDPPVTVTTTEDGQYTFWFLPQLGETPPIANQLTATASAVVDGHPRSGSLALQNLIPNGVTNAPSILLS
jgi:hypothetical protein